MIVNKIVASTLRIVLGYLKGDSVVSVSCVFSPYNISRHARIRIFCAEVTVAHARPSTPRCHHLLVT